MKKTILLACMAALAALTLTGCNDKESELEKVIKEGTETSKKMAGTNRPIPVPNLETDAPPPKKKEGK